MVFEVSTNMVLQLRLRLSQGFYRVFQFKHVHVPFYTLCIWCLNGELQRFVGASERLHHGFRRLVLRFVGLGLDSGSWGLGLQGVRV